MQKKSTILILLIVTSFMANAQFNKGQKVWGGNVGFSTGTSDVNVSDKNISKYTNISINPTFSKFTKSNQLVGFGVSYVYAYQKYISSNLQDYQKSRSNSFGASIFTQKFFPIAPKFFFTTQLKASADYSFGRNNYSTQTYTVTNKGLAVAVSVTPGLTYQLTNRWLIDGYLNNLFLAGYSYSWSNNPFDKRVTKNFTVSSSLTNLTSGNLALGFRYLLRN